MKIFLIFMTFVLFFVAQVKAELPAKGPFYYHAQFEVVSVVNSIATLRADIGCVDTLVFSEITPVTVDEETNVYVISLVRQHPDSDRIRCIKAQTVEKTVEVKTSFAKAINTTTIP